MRTRILIFSTLNLMFYIPINTDCYKTEWAKFPIIKHKRDVSHFTNDEMFCFKRRFRPDRDEVKIFRGTDVN